MNRKRIFLYFFCALLALRIILWYANTQILADVAKLNATSEKWMVQADSLKYFRSKVTDTVVINDIHERQLKLLYYALANQLAAREKLSQQLDLLNTLEQVATGLLFLFLIGMVYAAIKGK